ncbi:glycosyltransferase [Oceanicola sp. 502str15]|uniref:glycosyltransferase n=1 Tax=Oceanicola sp. 502str15 TaxID=2696061 RepID=UPI0020953DCE|nr:glycosyltransferase [Oceanicola sp. 502str15]
MSRAITFVDPLAPRGYSGAPGQLEGLGGTEATLVRVCEGLSSRLQIMVRQRMRPDRADWWGGVGYAGLDLKRPFPEAPGTIVVVNSWKVALKLARLHSTSRVIVWQHVFPGRHNRALAPDLAAAGIEVLCVSRSHADWLRRFVGGGAAPAIGHVCNPIDDALAPDDTPRDPDLLLFASSPHKGLGQVLERFEMLQADWPRLRLAIADPGYLAWPVGRMPPRVLPLGRLRQPELIGWMRRAACLFYPQDHFAETFGLVIAEANAVGCPAVLQRGLGANDEVASTAAQCIDSSDPDALRQAMAGWRDAAKRTSEIRVRPEFRFSQVLARWVDLLVPGAATRPSITPVPSPERFTTWQKTSTPTTPAPAAKPTRSQVISATR